MKPKRSRLIPVPSPWAARVAGSALLGLALFASCRTLTPTPAPLVRDINAVLEDHDDRLMAIPGVVGVCVSLLDDGKTPCLKVMLANGERKLKRSLPRFLEGHPVVHEVTGPIRPLGR